MNVPRRYGLMRAIAFLLRVCAWLALLIGLGTGLGSLLLAARPAAVTGIPGWIGVVGLASVAVMALIWFVVLYAFGGLLSLLVDIEQNTRQLAAFQPATAELLPASPYADPMVLPEGGAPLA